MNAETLKKDVSKILMSAVNGTNQHYRTEDGFIRWGRVEKDIHDKIDSFADDAPEPKTLHGVHLMTRANISKASQ